MVRAFFVPVFDRENDAAIRQSELLTFGESSCPLLPVHFLWARWLSGTR
jgi:hypothetical protein